MPQTASVRRPGPPAVVSANRSPGRRLISVSFILSLALVACRLLMSESTRNPQDPLAGGSLAPLPPGASTGIVLDLGFCLPALLVLVRRSFDDHFRLRFMPSLIPMGLLAALAALSPLWAADKFAAAVSAMHVVCAMVFLWSTSQLVRTWIGVRVVAGLCVGLLLAMGTLGYEYRLGELPELRHSFALNKAEILRAHGWKPGSFEATLFEGRVLKGMPMGYSTSPNTYAALIVLMGIVSAGVAIQRRADGDTLGWVIVPVLATGMAPALIYWTACRAAFATPLIAALILAGVWLFRRQMGRHAKFLYFVAVAAIGAVTAFVVRHGMQHQTLWHDSLTFRWHYWVGSFRVLTDGFKHSPRQLFHFLLGVGWENFGPYYLGHRLPIAAEEIRDPHNFIVRVFVELGMIGGALLLIWMLRLWWELTRPIVPATPADDAPAARPQGARLISLIASIAIVAMAINIPAAIDFGGDESNRAWSLLELMVRGFFGVAIAIGLLSASLRRPAGSTHSEPDGQTHLELDARPCPWILWAILAGLGTFLIHNLIEFSLFEPGPLFLFALLAGTALGARSQPTKPTAERKPNAMSCRRAATITLGLACAAWLGAAIFLAAPVAVAESLAHQSDADALAAANTTSSELYARAAATMHDAAQRLPWNSDYAFRAARIGFVDGDAQRAPTRVKALLDAACAADPSAIQPLCLRADLEFHNLADPDAGHRDFERALRLDPNNVRLRIEHARQLSKYISDHPKFLQAALLEYTMALDMNNQLAPDEIKRLSPDEAARVRKEIADLDALKAPIIGGRSF